MKTIVMLTCPKANTVCTGAACFHAFYERTHRFACYGKEEDVRIGAFMKCSGCGHFPGEDEGLDEKIERVLQMNPDAVHLGICCCHDGKSQELCNEVKAIAKIFKEQGIPVIRGTHSVF